MSKDSSFVRPLYYLPIKRKSDSDSTETTGDKEQLTYHPASGGSILRHAGTWSGDDFEECLQTVYATRGKAKFDDENPFE